jgi:hypothetical protein
MGLRDVTANSKDPPSHRDRRVPQSGCWKAALEWLEGSLVSFEDFLEKS